LKSKVTLLSTIVALLALWVLGCSLVGWGALNILISSVLGHLLAKWPTPLQLKHIVVSFADVEPSLWLGATFSIAFNFYAWPTSSWVLLFLFHDEGLTSKDCIS
jgi:hypothetical protein